MKTLTQKCTVFVLIGVALGLGVQRVAAQESNVVMGPYLQNLTSNGVVIRWVTVDDDDPSEFIYHKAPITGGQPDTEYEYTVGENGLFKGVYRTAPVDPVPFRFVVYGDTRTQPNVHSRVANLIVRERPAFVLHTGDLVDDGREARLWPREFFGPAAPLLSKVALFPVLGNHEGNSPLYYNLFDLPGNERYYSFDYGQVHFVMLDSNEPELPDRRRRETRVIDRYRQVVDEFWNRQLAWLRLDLAAHRDARLTVVCLHSPLYSSPEERDRVEDYRRMREWLELVLEQYGVDAVFSGHDHFYQRHFVNGIQYVVAGGGGAPLSVGGPELPTEVSRADEHHYVVISVEGKTAEARAISIDGETIETFTIGSGE